MEWDLTKNLAQETQISLDNVKHKLFDQYCILNSYENE